ncbi:hypothetical protein OY671_009249, partial [Metschnikowia pulcherrima]
RPPAVRRRPGTALPHPHRHRSQPERGGGGGDRHRGRSDQARGRRHRRHRQAGHGLQHRAARRPRHHHARLASRQGIRALRHRAHAQHVSDLGPVGLDQVRRVRHHLGSRRQPDRGQRLRQALRAGLDAGVRRDLGTDRRRTHRGRASRQRRRARTLHVYVRPLPGHDRPSEDQRPVRIAADQGQHRRRPDHHRGKGAGQHPEDRQAVPRRRRDRQGRDP